MTNFFIYFTGFLFLLSCTKAQNYKCKCNDPFFSYFRIAKGMVCKDINEFEFDDAQTYKKISIFHGKIGILYFRNDTPCFWIIDIKTGKEKNYEVRLERNENFQGYSFAFGFNSKLLLLCFNRKVYAGKLTPKVINLKLITRVDSSIHYVKVFDDRAILYDFGYRKSASVGYAANTRLYFLDFKNFSLKYVDLGVPKGFYFTLFYPPEVVDFTNGYIAHSEITEYRIKLFDKNGNYVTEIRKSDSLFKEIDTTLHVKFSNLLTNNLDNIKPALDSMRSTFFSGVGIIEKINFIDDSLLLVRWYGPKIDTSKWYPYIYYDLWKIKKDSAFLIMDNVLASFPYDTLLMSCYPLYSSRFESGSGYIVAFSSSYCLKPGEPTETLADYRKRQKKCENKNPLLGLTIYEVAK